MIVPTTRRTKLLLVTMFIAFHFGLIFQILILTNQINSFVNTYPIGTIVGVLAFLMLATGIPFGYIGHNYLRVRFTGKGNWCWSKQDLERYNMRNANHE